MAKIYNLFVVSVEFILLIKEIRKALDPKAQFVLVSGYLEGVYVKQAGVFFNAF